MLAIALVLVFAIASTAQAAFPGRNGRIAFVIPADPVNGDIYTMNPDGSGTASVSTDPMFEYNPTWSPDGTKIAFDRGSYTVATDVYTFNADGTGLSNLTDNPAGDSQPAWLPDGSKLAFVSDRDGNLEVYAMNADGTAQTRLTDSSAHDQHPAWSPDGTKIAFDRNSQIYTMNADGSGVTNLSNGPAQDAVPDWSPDGTKIAFARNGEVYTMNADGSGATNISNNPASDGAPAWSPDGTKIAFTSMRVGSSVDIYSMNADGSAQVRLTSSNDFGHYSPDWQPLRIPVRPRGATPLRVSLVPAYAACTSPNRTHGAPLAHGSCAPPVQASSQLTVGTFDANGQADQSIGSVTLKTILGNESTPADEADIRVDTAITDVRRVTGLADYNGELSTVLQVRLTDQLSEAQTVQAFPFRVTVPCTVTADTTVGSTCALVTTADTVMPGAVSESSRAIWALDKVEVYDGGPDGLASTTAGNTLFETQGVFVP